MAGEAAKLYQLQMIDLDIEEKQRQVQLLESKLGESAELRDARQKLAEADIRRKALQLQIRQVEADIDAKAAKIEDLKKRLFGGAVGKAKQAGALEKELAALKAGQARVEDQLIDLMSESEDLPAVIERLRADAQRLEGESEQQQLTLADQVVKARREIAALEATRRQQAAMLPAAPMQKYEELRRTHRGRAVAKVERNTCQGCRVALQMGEVQRIRGSQDLSLCSFCGRILYLER